MEMELLFEGHVCNKLKLRPSSHTSSRLAGLLTLHKDIEPTKDFYFYVQPTCYYFTLAIHLQVACVSSITVEIFTRILRGIFS